MPKSMFDQQTYLALRDELSCIDCTNIGVWYWFSGDHNANVWVCDDHKEEPYDTHEGPYENGNRRTISDYFKGV